MIEPRNWTREELILVFNLYCKPPFGSLHSRNPRVIELANIVERTPGAVALKLTNFASFDPYLQSRGIKGMVNVSKKDKEIWAEFTENWDELIFESEKILAKHKQQKIDKLLDSELPLLTGEEKIRKIKTRVNQNFFRQVVLNNYLIRCAICSLNISDLLIAGHIIPWSVNPKERMNPQNGICLCAIHDRAFEVGIVGIDVTYKVLLSNELHEYKNQKFYKLYFADFQAKQINLPEKFLPRIDFLEYHLNERFRKEPFPCLVISPKPLLTIRQRQPPELESQRVHLFKLRAVLLEQGDVLFRQRFDLLFHFGGTCFCLLQGTFVHLHTRQGCRRSNCSDSQDFSAPDSTYGDDAISYSCFPNLPNSSP